MRHTLLAALALSIAGCTDGAAPSPVGTAYFLSSVDGQPVPAPSSDLPDGWLLVSGHLAFGDQDRPRLGTTADDLVAYSRTVRRPDNVEETWTIDLRYTIAGGTITIDLCPPLALCVARTELIGPFDPDELAFPREHRTLGPSVHGGPAGLIAAGGTPAGGVP